MTLELPGLDPDETRAFVSAFARIIGGGTAGRGWAPLPYQVPPPVDATWDGWLLMGGRGVGKTDTGAGYIDKHMMGPPCISHGAHPHWGAIIAPTQQDASTSCVEGPTGLKSHNPAITVVTSREGTIAKWPNGAQAKLYGTDTEKATDALRSGGNTCLAAGTLVATSIGPVPIEQVQAGDHVWTRNGLRRVLRSAQTGYREVVNVGDLRVTPDHLVATPGGQWEPAAVVDRMLAWDERSLSGMGCVGINAKTVTTPPVGTDCCTARSTPSITDRSRPVGMCTTLTMTKPITLRRTWPLWTRVRTLVNTSRSAAIRGIRTAVGRAGLTGCQPNGSASCVDVRTGRVLRGRSSAGLDAGTLARRHERGPNGCALCADQGSPVRSDVRPVLAVRRVDRSIPIASGPPEPVYDLLVEHDHEFFANGVLVANCIVWAEELAAWRWLDLAWAMMTLGLRSGPHPRWIATTTPKPRKLIKQMDKGEIPRVVISRASTDDNPHLAAARRETYYSLYGGTSLGMQELGGRIVEEDQNALWQRANIAANRLQPELWPREVMKNITVGVDPSGGAGEQGIVVIGKTLFTPPARNDDGTLITPAALGGTLPAGFVLDDRTCCLPPEGWGRRAVNAAVEWEANDICVEVNFGGDMAVSTIVGAAEAMGVPIPVRTVRASRGKAVRAEPVAALATRGRLPHVGEFPELEDQLCVWTPDADYSPDRLDGCVWGVSHLGLVSTIFKAPGSVGSTAAVASRSLTGWRD